MVVEEEIQKTVEHIQEAGMRGTETEVVEQQRTYENENDAQESETVGGVSIDEEDHMDEDSIDEVRVRTDFGTQNIALYSSMQRTEMRQWGISQLWSHQGEIIH